MRTCLTVLLLASCNGDDITNTDPTSCDTIVAGPLGGVDVYEWPPGVAEALALYATLDGRYEAANSCGGEIIMKFTHPDQEELQIVTEPWPDVPGLACGCTVDPHFPPDPALAVAVLHSNFEVFLENFTDPGISSRTLITSGAFYSPGDPLAFRTCGSTDIDPLLGSAFTGMSLAVRVPSGGETEATITLADESGGVEVCEMTNFSLIAPN